jgi:hypothetical protein
MDGILRQMELAALPGDAAKDGASCGAEPGMVIGGDELDASQGAKDGLSEFQMRFSGNQRTELMTKRAVSAFGQNRPRAPGNKSASDGPG